MTGSPASVGHVREINRYPVKSMAGERREVAEIDWQGIEGDRQYAFVRRDDTTRFPWFTGRDHSDLVRYRATYDDPTQPRRSAVSIRTPGGATSSLHDPQFRHELEDASGVTLDLLQLGIGAYDLMPVSVVTTASLARLDAVHETLLDHRRFRVNVVVDSDLPEGDWQGSRVRFGDGADAPELFFAYPAPRCAMITIDPDTAQRDPRVLRTVARQFGNAFCIYASVARPGLIREGAPVRLVR